ncbi:MAG: endonuclease III domain-containing protein [Acidobacteria bacterium]|nr:endonuclease III domain-containing protein [Acidobacteriota bacterium]
MATWRRRDRGTRGSGALRSFYRVLSQHFGPQHWWPGDTTFEILVGAILTQNTAWTNVEKAIANLKQAGALRVRAMGALAEGELAELIRPSGYYNQKAQKLKAFLDYLQRRHGGSLRRMFRVPTQQLRQELLAIHGIGEETADSILLYGGNHPIFVVDAYTRRILERHQMIPAPASYQQIQEVFHRQVAPSAPVYNEFHALLVQTGKQHCLKSEPRCAGCPLEGFPHRV